MVFLEFGTIRNAQILIEPIKSLFAAIGLSGAIHLQHEYSDGFSETRVVLGEYRSGPDDPQPFHLVFKVGAADDLRDEISRYIELSVNARATAAFVPIWKADLTLKALPVDDTLAAIAYGHASDIFGELESVSFKSVFRECIKGEYPMPIVSGMIETLARVLCSLYSKPTRCYAHEAALYYLEHWAPDYQVVVDHLVDRENRPLLTLQRLNPDHFRSEIPSIGTNLRRDAESPSNGSYPDIALPTCTVAKVGRERLVVWVNSADDLALNVDTKELPTASLSKITRGSLISLWTPRKVSRYDFYARQIRLALPSLDAGALSFKAGPLCVHNPLAHFSVPLLAATKPPALTWTVPGHGDLHPGNVLVTGTSPAIIDYGKSTRSIPVGVDAARFFGGLVRDVLADVFSFEDLAKILAESLGLETFAKEADSPASRAVYLLKLLIERLVPSSAPNSQALWPVHLYGYAWIGLKWPYSSPEAYRASFLLAGLALQCLLGVAPAEEEVSLASGGGEEKPAPPITTTRPIRPEGPAEILILVSRFDGSADYNPTVRIYSTLADHVFEIISGIARVEQIEEVVSSRKDAEALAGRYRASMIVWGTFDNFGVSPHYEVTRDSLVVKRSMVQLDQATRHHLSERFEPYITQNLAAEISFLSLMAVAGMCELNLNSDAAIKVYQRALTLISDRERARELGAASIYRSLAALYFIQKRDKEATEANDKAREFDPSDLATELQRLQIRSRMEKITDVQQIEEVKKLLRARVEANSDSPEIVEILQEVLAKLESLNTFADFRKLQQTKSTSMQFYSPNDRRKQYKKDVAVHLQRAQDLFFNGNKVKQSLAEIRSALRLNPRCAQAFVLRANVLAIMDHVEDALKDLDKAESLDPKEPNIFCIRGHIYYSNNDFPLSLREFEKGLELGIKMDMVLPEWGIAMTELGRGDEAMQSVRDGDLDPSDYNIFIFRSHYYRNQGKYEIALGEANQALELVEQSSNVAQANSGLTERAFVYEAMGLPEQAIQDLELAVKYLPEGTFARRSIHEKMVELKDKLRLRGRTPT